MLERKIKNRAIIELDSLEECSHCGRKRVKPYDLCDVNSWRSDLIIIDTITLHGVTNKKLGQVTICPLCRDEPIKVDDLYALAFEQSTKKWKGE